MEDQSADGSWLLSRQTLNPVERALFGLFAPVPLMAVRELAIEPWPAILSVAGLLILGPIVLGAATISVLLAAAALLGPEREIRVDPMARLVIDTGRARWLGRWGRRIPFEDIEEVALRKDYDTDGGDRLQLVLVLRGRTLPLVLLDRPRPRRAELEVLAARLRAALQP
ncbi:hypothetical protein Rumeso_00798 [Rubellimicrobium mesophilum DSM 19309]|uniref:Uncharacterized protein n=1 Tax=Rubellimicrobium mesophilum DSM 19309 TaxID=442562 RepID=A0A017HT22_9RHOB|nr:hypothetical protein [Rubellimicrobium mesophilum]EYD77632.1 hypothetical protein Rumeso_00798 [Rubellimicrobium mesophilum DSM 19309]